MIDLEGILKGVEDLQFIIIDCCVDVLAVSALIFTYIDKILAFIRRREGRERGGGGHKLKSYCSPPLCPFLSHTHLLSCILFLHHLPPLLSVFIPIVILLCGSRTNAGLFSLAIFVPPRYSRYSVPFLPKLTSITSQ